ncbi:Cytochrome P450 84A4 [Hibiscus syriacus]|uniref:Cytochrome P450 84A4 n=1 Tax=Hibiscus syriacus TaxID=106335 RepID=A0A6A2WZX2_HIBSY|nr:cytochrome P450 84A1-like [Hibiscus syriacus]KAE8667391.1 Cytochrome P450 84A4 [Hibiscus syriacus]
MDSIQTLLSLQSSSPIFFLLPALLVSLIFMFGLRRKIPYPPGPKGYPIIGNMTMMDQLTHRGIAQLASRYGQAGLLHLAMGKLHIVAVSTPEMAKEVLLTQDIVYSNRPANDAIVYLTYDRADMAFANYGPFWRQMRKICVMKVFSRKRAESWASVREEVDSTVETVMKSVGSPLNVGELVFALTRNITYRAAFGSFSREGQDEFVKILQEFSKLFGAFNIADFFPWLSWVHGTEFHKRLVKARASLDGFIDHIIDEHLVRRNMGHAEKHQAVHDDDMVDELMAFYSENASIGDYNDSSNSSIQLTKNNIKAIIMDVMFGGTETVASAIEWAMAELMKSPEELEKVQQELSDVVGLDRVVQESDLEKLTYLKCAIKETLRLHPPIPLLLHETSVDSVLGGYRVPAKSRIMINAWAIGRDPSSWEDPDVFKPSRFLDGSAPDFKGSNFEFIPFGSGRRSCPGMQLGLYGLELSVAHLLHCFNWKLPDGMKPSELDMNDSFGLTAPRATRLVAVPSYRLSCPFRGK